MPNAKREQKKREYECASCGLTFLASRDHAETCSPKCRKRLNRERRHESRTRLQAALLGTTDVSCGACGIKRKSFYYKCPVCNSSATA